MIDTPRRQVTRKLLKKFKPPTNTDTHSESFRAASLTLVHKKEHTHMKYSESSIQTPSFHHSLPRSPPNSTHHQPTPDLSSLTHPSSVALLAKEDHALLKYNLKQGLPFRRKCPILLKSVR